MDELRHLFPRSTASAENYTAPSSGGGSAFQLPPRDDRVSHSQKLVTELEEAATAAKNLAKDAAPEKQPKGICLDFESDPDFKLQLESLELLRSHIELRNSRVTKDNVMHGTVFVPEGKLGIFVRKLEAYAIKDDPQSGKPKNQKLAESISKVRLAALESFWTDAGAFPTRKNESCWWEVWLRDVNEDRDIAEQFREQAQSLEIVVKLREVRFPERRVLLARSTVKQLSNFENLFDILAELRIARTLAGEFVELPPRDQAEYIEAAKARIEGPPADAAAVCHLDTGVNAGHTLLAAALSEEDTLTVDPAWTAADIDGHGTAMAGLALFGDRLAEILEDSDVIRLGNRLESVKILPDLGDNEPDMYGEITSQAASRIEIVAPQRNRAFCLTVTVDGCNEGRPLCWSAAVDQLCAGVDGEGSPQRLMLVSAGNTPCEGRHEYPSHSHLHGIEDPAQAWNAIAVGAYTEKSFIDTDDYEGWQPVAPPGGLSPASRTSLIWPDRVWPLKPDIVMEGGNKAINPIDGSADDVDDLLLLTTKVGPSGAPMLTVSGDTSGAAALAARCAAMIWTNYPALRPETVRALLIHSANWTDQMVTEFPGKSKTDLESRIRCYGFGTPDLQRALWSASDNATMIIEDSLQPFRIDGSVVKTKEMHLHALPWPRDVLEGMGETEVRMRVTLSYFIEPSPGRRGWTRKHSYQSHGLRYEVKRPEESDQDFCRRINQAARDEEDETSYGSDDRDWQLGDRLRRKGSIHSDVWSGTGAQLAAAGKIGVYPISGWWRFRKHLGRWNQQARYSMIISLETDAQDVDLHTAIANEIGVPVATEIGI